MIIIVFFILIIDLCINSFLLFFNEKRTKKDHMTFTVFPNYPGPDFGN